MAFWQWSKTAATNANADPTINWAEGMPPGLVNDSGRAQMARTAEYRDDTNGSLTTGGISTAYTITTNQGFTSLAVLDKQTITVVPHTTSGASPTLVVDGLAAEPIHISTGVAPPIGALLQGTPYRLTYYNSTTEFIVDGIVLPSDVLKSDVTSTISKGYTLTPNNAGTVSSGTFTPDPTQGNYQFYMNNGAHTVANPSSDCAIDILITNGASAGAISFSGFTVGANVGDALTTTNTNKFILSIRRINSVSTYLIKALQ